MKEKILKFRLSEMFNVIATHFPDGGYISS